MKRILHISKYYYPFRGGTEQVARDCVNALMDNYEQKIICFSEDRADSKDRVDDIAVTRAGCIIKIASQSISLSYKWLLKEIIEDYTPDIIIFHYPNPFVAHFLLKFIPKKCKLVIYWHLDIVKQRILRLFFLNQNKKLINKAHLLIATSPSYIDGSKYLSREREKCVVIPNCINEARLIINQSIKDKAEQIRNNNGDKTICVAVGRHTKYKGFEYLIQAIRLLDESFRLFLIGKGKETKHLKKLANGDERIVFLGSLDDDDLKAYMLAMDIFCFPSVTRNEAFGVSLAEAMYYGKPAVTFTIPGSGVNYVCINGENGIEVPNGNSKLYADALKKLSEQEELRAKMGEASRKRIITSFTPNQYKEKTKNAINGLFQ